MSACGVGQPDSGRIITAFKLKGCSSTEFENKFLLQPLASLSPLFPIVFGFALYVHCPERGFSATPVRL